MSENRGLERAKRIHNIIHLLLEKKQHAVMQGSTTGREIWAKQKKDYRQAVAAERDELRTYGDDKLIAIEQRLQQELNMAPGET